MSLAEIAYRLRKAAFMLIQRFGFFTARKVPAVKPSDKASSFIKGAKHLKAGCYLRAADKILEGTLPIFVLKENKFSPFSDWNLDPFTGRQAPLLFGKTLNYRDEAIVGDIKYLWEPNRHLHLVTLAQAYQLSKDNRYIDGLAVQIDTWLDQCPYLHGPNWTSSLELAIRLINWSLMWQLVGEEKSPLFEGETGKKRLNRFISSVYQHAHFIQGHYSKYSSANNHLIGEAAGLYIATTMWPYWSQCKSWQKIAQNILEKETQKQNAPDGVNREQAISYQQFVLDFLILAGLAGKANASEFSAVYWQRIEEMIVFLASIMDVAGNVPMIGDADDGYVVQLSREDNWCPYRSLLATGAVLFNRSDFKAKAGSLDDKTRWIFGDEIEPLYAKLESKELILPVHRAFKEGGYYILGCDLETSEEIRIVVDAGPIGYEGIAAHGHADALAFTLNIAGYEFLVDPGTYAYHTQKMWRDYFRGTAAHNTLCIDNQDQSVSGGSFIWLKKAQAWCEHWETGVDLDHFIGAHNGYSRLQDPLTHRREIILLKAEKKIIVKDILLCKSKHYIKGYWHFSEACTVKLTSRGVEAVNANKSIVLGYVGGDASYSIAKGDTSRPAGWVSRRFGDKVAAPTVIWESVVHGDTTFMTEIHCH